MLHYSEFIGLHYDIKNNPYPIKGLLISRTKLEEPFEKRNILVLYVVSPIWKRSNRKSIRAQFIEKIDKDFVYSECFLYANVKIIEIIRRGKLNGESRIRLENSLSYVNGLKYREILWRKY